MSTFISEPGTKLGGRYRLEDRLAAATGWSAWKAIDETLARPVTVVTLAAGFPRIAEVVTAARAASTASAILMNNVLSRPAGSVRLPASDALPRVLRRRGRGWPRCPSRRPGRGKAA